MENLYLVGVMILSYLLGSIPTAVWVGKWFYGIDVREHGSGNAGANNTFRVLGVKAGVPVLLVDAIKGYLATTLVIFVPFIAKGTPQEMNLKILLGIISVVGHIFPIFAQFRGGKGVATLAGMVIALHPLAAASSLAVFIIILMTSRIVSLSSMSAGVMFPVFLIEVYNVQFVSMVIFSITAAVTLLVTHRKNIERIIHREESRANIYKFVKKKSNR